MKLTTTIEIDGIELQVTGVFCEGYGPSWTDPGEPDSFEIYSLTDNGIDVMHLHDDAYIEQLAIDACQADDEYERERYADMRREDVRLGMV